MGAALGLAIQHGKQVVKLAHPFGCAQEQITVGVECVVKSGISFFCSVAFI
jgi:hypothetical protein